MHRVLLRADFNVPMRDGEIEDDLRITASLPTIKWLLERNCEIVACSHLGRPKGKVDPKYSMAPVAKRLSELLDREVQLAPGITDFDTLGRAESLDAGQIMLVENLRFDPGEEANDPAFAHQPHRARRRVRERRVRRRAPCARVDRRSAARAAVGRGSVARRARSKC